MKLLKLTNLPYIVIIILLVIVLFQNKSCSNIDTPEPKITIDTVYYPVIDTIYADPEIIYTKPDTVWKTDTLYIPSSTYTGLLTQYTALGNKYFQTNVFKSKFQIADYGHIEVTDSIKENILQSSTIITDLQIPTTIITIEKERPPKMQLYAGPRVVGNPTIPISGIYGDILLKTKRDKIYGISVGWQKELTYGANLYYPIKFKRR